MGGILKLVAIAVAALLLISIFGGVENVPTPLNLIRFIYTDILGTAPPPS